MSEDKAAKLETLLYQLERLTRSLMTTWAKAKELQLKAQEISPQEYREQIDALPDDMRQEALRLIRRGLEEAAEYGIFWSTTILYVQMPVKHLHQAIRLFSEVLLARGIYGPEETSDGQRAYVPLGGLAGVTLVLFCPKEPLPPAPVTNYLAISVAYPWKVVTAMENCGFRVEATALEERDRYWTVRVQIPDLFHGWGLDLTSADDETFWFELTGDETRFFCSFPSPDPSYIDFILERGEE